MKTRTWVAAGVLCAAAAVTLALAATSGAAASGEETLMSADQAFCEATAAKGLEGWLSFFAPDATIYPASRPAVGGLAAIREHYKETGFDPRGLTWKPLMAKVSAGGDLGFTSGAWEMRGAGSSQRPPVRGKYLTVWQRQKDGRFLVLADIGSADAPPKGQ